MTSRIALAIPAGEFKAKCLHIMDEVNQTRQSIIITKRGKPVAKLIPFAEEKLKLFGKLKGSMTLLSDITQPVAVVWHADE